MESTDLALVLGSSVPDSCLRLTHMQYSPARSISSALDEFSLYLSVEARVGG